MKDGRKYKVGASQGFEAGSDNKVLKNNLKIVCPKVMEEEESESLDNVHHFALDNFSSDHKFTENDLFF